MLHVCLREAYLYSIQVSCTRDSDMHPGTILTRKSNNANDKSVERIDPGRVFTITQLEQEGSDSLSDFSHKQAH